MQIPRHAGPPFHGKPGRVRGDRTTRYRDLFGPFPGRSTVAQARLSVRKIGEVLRLKAEARLSDRQIAAVIGSARSTVQECLRRVRSAGSGWPVPPEHRRGCAARAPVSADADGAALPDTRLPHDPGRARAQGRHPDALAAGAEDSVQIVRGLWRHLRADHRAISRASIRPRPKVFVAHRQPVHKPQFPSEFRPKRN